MRRVFKAVFPMAMAASIVFVIMLTIFYFIPLMLAYSGGHIMVINHSLLAILLSVVAISLGHFLFIRRQSKFQPIRIRVRRKSPPFDKDQL